MDQVGDTEGSGEHVGTVPDGLTAALASTARVSDIMGRLGEGNFVVVAPGTDPGGAHRLAMRLLAAVDDGVEPRATGLPRRVRAGYYAIHDTEEASVSPVDLLTRATLALRDAQADETGQRIHAYQAVRAAG
jgi:GGDEF domain-containing protein